MREISPTPTRAQVKSVLQRTNPQIIGRDEDIAARLSQDADALCALFAFLDFPCGDGPRTYFLELLAISKGRRGWINVPDAMIAERVGKTERSIRRWRGPILDWLREGGRGVLAIESGRRRPGPGGLPVNEPTRVDLGPALDLLSEAFPLARGDVRMGGDERSRRTAWTAALREAACLVDTPPARPVRPRRRIAEATRRDRAMRAVLTILARLVAQTAGITPEERAAALYDLWARIRAIFAAALSETGGEGMSLMYSEQSGHPGRENHPCLPPEGPAEVRATRADGGPGVDKMSTPQNVFVGGEIELPQTLPESPVILRTGNAAGPGPLGGGEGGPFPDNWIETGNGGLPATGNSGDNSGGTEGPPATVTSGDGDHYLVVLTGPAGPGDALPENRPVSGNGGPPATAISPGSGPPAACSTRRAFALDYAERGRLTLPNWWLRGNVCACPRGPSCTAPGKHPLYHPTDLPAGVASASADLELVTRWWARWPSASPGWALDPEVLVLDFDGQEGLELHAEWEARGLFSPGECEAITGGGGRHVAVRLPAGVRFKNLVRVAPGLDLRGHGSQIIVEPSAHISGGSYRWVGGPEPLRARPALIEALTGLLARKRATVGAGVKTTGGKMSAGGPRVYVQGSRNDSVFRDACYWHGRGASEHALRSIIYERAEWCRPSLSAGEVEKIIASVMRYPAGERKP